MMDINERRSMRLKILKEICPQGAKTDEIIKRLRQSGVVSSNYSEKCARVDEWSILHKNDLTTIHVGNNTCLCDFSGLWFHVIKEALMDYESGRPCDLKAWYGDLPPVNKQNCQADHHICAPAAKDFLVQIANTDYEIFAGLGPGTITEIMAWIDEKK